MKPSVKYLNSRTSVEEMQTNLQILSQTFGWISRSLAESFRCAAGHLKFRYQTRYSNLPVYIDNIGFLLPS